MKTTLKVHRVNKGISIEDAAEALEITVDQLRKYEAYEESCDWKFVLKVMQLYDIDSIDDIIFHNKAQEKAVFAKKGINILFEDELPTIE